MTAPAVAQPTILTRVELDRAVNTLAEAAAEQPLTPQHRAGVVLADLLSRGLPGCTWVVRASATAGLKGMAESVADVRAWADAMPGADLRVDDYTTGGGTLNAYATVSGVPVRVWVELTALDREQLSDAGRVASHG